MTQSPKNSYRSSVGRSPTWKVWRSHLHFSLPENTWWVSLLIWWMIRRILRVTGIKTLYFLVLVALLNGCGTAGAAFVRGAAEAYNQRNSSAYATPPRSTASNANEMQRLENQRREQETEMRRMQQQICDQAMRSYNSCLMRQRGGDHSQLCFYPVAEC